MPLLGWLYGNETQPVRERAIRVFDAYQKTYESLERQGYYMNDWYAENGQMFAIAVKDGRLYRFDTAIENDELTLSDPVEVALKFEERKHNNLSIIRQADGKMRWIAAPAGVAVLNKDSEIDSRKLFDDFIARIKRKDAQYPTLRFFHGGPALDIGTTDFLYRDEYCLIASGLVDEGNDLAAATARSMVEHPEYWGTSIAFMPKSDADIMRVSGVDIPVYESGEIVEISVLPQRKACHFLTRIEVARSFMTKDLAEALKFALGNDEDAKLWASRVDDVNRAAAQMINRSTDEATPPPAPAPKATDTAATNLIPEKPGDALFEIGDDVIRAVTSAYIASPEHTALVGRVAALEGSLKVLAENFQSQVDAHAETLRAFGEFRGKVNDRITPLERNEVERETEIIASLPQRNLNTRHVGYRPSQPPPTERAVEDNLVTTNYEQRAIGVLDKVKPNYVPAGQ